MSYPSELSEPFLIHLTRPHEKAPTAKESMRSICRYRTLFPGTLLLDDASLSDARFLVNRSKLTKLKIRRYFGFISFTETPLREVHRLCDIRQKRQKELSGYGLVFLKNWLVRLGASPAIYINNVNGDRKNGNRNEALRSLASCLIRKNPSGAEQILPLVAVFGEPFKAVGAKPIERDDIDFTWEREWRLPYSKASFLVWDKNDIFVGLCPDKEIKEFEELLPSVPFIDPKALSDYEDTIKRRCRELNPKLFPPYPKLAWRSILGK